MIYVGLTGWGDHDHLYRDGVSPRDKLKAYAAFFPIVEVDSSFYAVQPERNWVKWIGDTPEDFGFIVKAYQGMTGHLRGKNPFASTDEMFRVFRESLTTVRESGKLAMVLFQYPPWFECVRENVETLRYAKERMGDIPAALEFRHQSWFAPDMRDKTLAFMQKEGWIHSVCDEPQAGAGSVPTVLEPTDPDKTLVRLHGRNGQGWNNHGQSNWQEVRYLYRYNRDELLEWKQNLEVLERGCKQIYVVFNNNSGGDAAENAKEMIALLGAVDQGTAPRQMDLFK